MSAIIWIGFACFFFGLLLAIASAAGFWVDETDREYEDRLLMRHFERQNGKKRRK